MRETVALAETSLVRIRDLLKQFKEISVSQLDYKLSNESLLSSVQEGVNQHANRIEAQHVDVSVECAEDLALYSYHKAIVEVVQQLVVNSLDHGFSNTEDKKIKLCIIEENHNITITYTDNGIGLTEEGAEKLFHPFYTTMRGCQGKVGLGMYITYNIVTQLLNGQIDICPSESGLCLEIQFTHS